MESTKNLFGLAGGHVATNKIHNCVAPYSKTMVAGKGYAKIALEHTIEVIGN